MVATHYTLLIPSGDWLDDKASNPPTGEYSRGIFRYGLYGVIAESGETAGQ